jgi:hypothetical protein
METQNPKKNSAARRARMMKKAENIAKFQPKPKLRKCRTFRAEAQVKWDNLATEHFFVRTELFKKQKEEISKLDIALAVTIRLVEEGKIFCSNHLKDIKK